MENEPVAPQEQNRCGHRHPHHQLQFWQTFPQFRQTFARHSKPFAWLRGRTWPWWWPSAARLSLMSPPTVSWPRPILPVLQQSIRSMFEPFVKGPALCLLIKSPLCRLLKSPHFSCIGLFLGLDFRFDSRDGVRTNLFDQSDDVLVIWLLSSNATELSLVKIS